MLAWISDYLKYMKNDGHKIISLCVISGMYMYQRKKKRHSVHTLNNSLIFVESNSVHILIDLHGHMLSDHVLTPPSSHCSLESL